MYDVVEKEGNRENKIVMNDAIEIEVNREQSVLMVTMDGEVQS